jgi:LuxR family transcriptional regulator, quorum-sensing system regulator CviR
MWLHPMKNLTKNDLLILLEIIDDALNCQDMDSYKQLVLKMQLLINFESAFCIKFNLNDLLAKKDAELSFTIIRYPEEYLERYIAKSYNLIDPVGKEYLKTFDIQNWTDVMRKYKRDPGAVAAKEARDFGLKDGMTYGIPNLVTGVTTAYSFAGKSIDNDERTRFILKYAIPHLSQTYLSLLDKAPVQKYNLTQRELEVLRWLKEGKSSWEISMILNKSEITINFHIKNILKKLNAMNRAHAVAIALENRLIAL